MYSTSTQKRFWVFESPEIIENLRRKNSAEMLKKYGLDSADSQSSDILDSFLTFDEEYQLCQLVADTAVKFCRSFYPPMPPSVIWTAFTYFRRLFLKHSVTELSPKTFMMVCLYLACKVEEFNISTAEFVRNLKSGTEEQNTDLILSLEPDVMLKLDYHLTVHSPFRPLEGHLIDLKTQFPKFKDPERLRPGCEAFLSRALLSDAPLLFPPSQIAFAALAVSAADLGESLDPYITTALFPAEDDSTTMEKFIARIQNVITIVQSTEPVTQEAAGNLQNRAKKCMEVIAQLEEKRLATSSAQKRKLEGDNNSSAAKRHAWEDEREAAEEDDDDDDDDL